MLDQMKDDIDELLMNSLTPLQLRLFIFEEEIKNIVFYKSLPLTVSRSQKVLFNLNCKTC